MNDDRKEPRRTGFYSFFSYFRQNLQDCGGPTAGGRLSNRMGKSPPSVKTLAEGVSGDFRHSGDGAGWLLVELICRQKTLQRLPLKPLNS